MIFDLSNIKVEIKLAFAYSPKVMNNYIKTRVRTGLLYVSSGEYIYSWEDSSFSGKSGSLIYLPPNCVPYNYQINTVCDKAPKTMQIELEITNMSSGEPVAFSNHPLLISETADSAVRDCFEKIISGQGKNDFASELLIHSKLYELLSMCVKSIEEDPVVSLQPSIAPALNFIRENYRSEFSVSDLAKLCHISESQLRRNFLAAIGKSPIKYKNELILKDACRFLSDGEIGIGTIANILGFCDSYAFSHFFKKLTGISASTYKTNAAKQKLNS
ncbi:MAG: helix-turn-helix transcriptional regulator [Clostridia bacterium]|nr:helix-turn-helix transcriptional regulator [Clostridia bacterium]